MEFADRVAQITPSETVAIIDKVREMEAAGTDVTNFTTGTQAEPRDFVTPEHISEASQAALDDGQTHLAPSKGLPELREALAAKLRDENDVPVESDQVLVTPGTKYALFESVLSFVDPGDEVVVLDPSWVSYNKMVDIADGTVERVSLDDEFLLRNADLDEAVGDSTRLVVLNTPLNATGGVFTREGLERLRDLAVEHDFWVLSDEIYEKLIYEGEHHAIASFDGMAERTITVSGFSKAYSMLGWRIGYLAAPQAFVDEVAKVHSNSVTAVPTFLQHGAIEAVTGPQDHVAEKRAELARRRDIMVERLADAGLDFPKPHSGMYMFIPVDTEDDVQFCKDILDDKQLAFTPGSAFGTPGYVRATWVLPDDELRAGLDAFVDYVA
ncbi:pyridoxal phosphate-dependent aminotransferase [Halovivax limisalsi]|uniref:pyridoxal phosphate-dependent aminotransferase n=1 Tax=Halovivax limisalsi TaxID=1453760 RepID=UPI001FFD74A6|nr:pyridoxal phosphate-dependent aminotransferase [Halovivax limisalsi]